MHRLLIRAALLATALVGLALLGGAGAVFQQKARMRSAEAFVLSDIHPSANVAPYVEESRWRSWDRFEIRAGWNVLKAGQGYLYHVEAVGRGWRIVSVEKTWIV